MEFQLTPESLIRDDHELNLPSMKPGHKTVSKFPIDQESPSKPSKVKNIIQPFTMVSNQNLNYSPDLYLDEDTFSDSSIVSPISDISSAPSSSPELCNEKFFYGNFLELSNDELLTLPDIPVLGLPFYNDQEYMNLDIDIDVNIITKSMQTRSLANSIPSDKLVPIDFLPKKRVSAFKDVFNKRIRFEPKHHSSLKPISILKLSPNRLNFIMSSSNGNVRDATIFATEINACNCETVPLPTSIRERVSIPVNSEVKNRYKSERGDFLGGYYDDVDDCKTNQSINCSSNYNDAAIIRAYEFKRLVQSPSSVIHSITSNTGVYSYQELISKKSRNSLGRMFKKKQVKWDDKLEW